MALTSAREERKDGGSGLTTESELCTNEISVCPIDARVGRFSGGGEIAAPRSVAASLGFGVGWRWRRMG
ncbi:hypothetical protein HA466_0138750 [Hirschfeldia incana]|nr:hypothetical protein HA466_0138750 [Hirschfeldia incana]